MGFGLGHGVLEEKDGDRVVLHFEYDILRVWEESIEGLLAYGPTLAPLAILTDEAAKDFKASAYDIFERLQKNEETSKIAKDLLTPMMYLSGLRDGKELSEQVFMSLKSVLEQSHTYQLSQRIARIENTCEMILEQGTIKFGSPSDSVREAIKAINDLGQVRALGLRMMTVDSWDELLTPLTNG